VNPGELLLGYSPSLSALRMRGLVSWTPSAAPAAFPAVSMVAADPPPLPHRLRRLSSALRAPSSPRERTLRLMRLGETLPPADSLQMLRADTRVPGCTSVVHVLASVSAKGTLDLSGMADSRLARGLVALLVRGLRGEPLESFLALSAEDVSEAAGLTSVLSPSRLNGVANMLETMRAQLQSAAAEAEDGEDAAAASGAPSGRGEAAGEAAGAAVGAVAGAGPSAAPWLAPSGFTWAAAEEEVAVLLSGGVDSSVALRLLQEQGQRCRAFYLRIWLEDEQAEAAKGACPWEEDWEYASAVCAQAGVPLEAVSLQQEYQDEVVGYLVAEAEAGRTPNPDIMCNTRVKFGAFQRHVGRHFKGVASGHYARVAPAPPAPYVPSLSPSPGAAVAVAVAAPVQLLRAADAHKDQTYFLSQLQQGQLSNVMFPVGELTKPQVRETARRFALPNRERKDSQGICFLGKVDYSEFLRQHLGERPGAVLEHETHVQIGTHNGLWFHTVGQRKGLGPVLAAPPDSRLPLPSPSSSPPPSLSSSPPPSLRPLPPLLLTPPSLGHTGTLQPVASQGAMARHAQGHGRQCTLRLPPGGPTRTPPLQPLP
jgi:tRNA U34 2-thiouridine synthase MnmA/TrmU/sulfur transfer protein SufE